MRGPFQIFKRSYKGTTQYFARFQDQDGRILKEIKLDRVKNRTSAVLEAKKLIDLGMVPGTEDPLVLDFIQECWTYDSLYVRYRARRGIILSKRYVEDSRKAASKRFSAILKNKHISELSPILLERGIDALEKSGLGTRSINIALQTVKVPIAWYARMHRIPNPLQYVSKLAEHPREKTVLSPLEVSKLIKVVDESPRGKAIVLLGVLCGMRMGEVRGLQWKDVDFENNLISICHNVPYGSNEVKAPKWNSFRVVPLPPSLVKTLKAIQTIPFASPLFVIYNEAGSELPSDVTTINRALIRMFRRISITKETKKSRRLSFHSLRHTFISLSRAGGIPDFLVQRLAGHKSSQMMDHYSHAENIIDYGAAQAKFQSVLDVADLKEKEKDREKELVVVDK